MQLKKSYQFTGGIAKVFTNRQVVFFPVWCPMIGTASARDTLAQQLRAQRGAR